MKRVHLPGYKALMAFSLLCIMSLAACGDNTIDPAAENNPTGFILKAGGVEKARMANGAITGTLQIDRGLGQGGKGVPTEEMEITFTMKDGSVYTPAANDSLAITPSSTDLLGVEHIPGSPFRFRLLGKGAGKRSFRVDLVRKGTPAEILFSSNQLQVIVTITTEGLEVTKLRAVGPSNALATVVDTVVTGSLTGSSFGAIRTIEVELYDATDNQIFFFGKPEIQLIATITDTSLATVERADPLDQTTFNIIGKHVGSTTIQFTVMYNDGTQTYEAFTTPLIPLEVQ